MTLAAPQIGSPAFLAPALAGLQNGIKAAGASVSALTTGNSFATAGDNLTAFSVSSTLQSQLAGIKQGASNAAAGTSLLQVAASGLQQISDIVSTLQSLATQASNPSLLAADRASLQEQFTQNISALDTIANNTTFNNVSLLNGGFAGGVSFQVGQTPNNSITVTIASAASNSLFGGSPPDIGTVGDATSAATAITTASNNLQTIISKVTGFQQAFEAASHNLSATLPGIAGANNALANTDVQAETTALAQQQITLDTGRAVIAQVQSLQPKLLHALLAPVLPKTTSQTTDTSSSSTAPTTATTTAPAAAAAPAASAPAPTVH